MSKYKNLLFDLDGTLTDSAEGILNCVKYSLDKLNVNYDKYNLWRFIGPPLFESYMEIFDDEELSQRAVKIYRERFAEKGIFENAVYGGIPEALAELKKAGFKLYTATSKPEVYAKRIAEHFGFADYFEEIAGASLEEGRSRKADVIRYVMGRHNMLSSETLMIGDRMHDMEGAKEAGIDAMGVSYGYGSREELAEWKPVCIAPAPMDIFLYLK